MDYIRKAVKLKPDDGYYVDSLGWAYFRLGNMPAAVEQLEHAVELKPDDPVVNDHLGDAYWRVGRTARGKISVAAGADAEARRRPVVTLEKKLKSGLQASPETKAADRTRQRARRRRISCRSSSRDAFAHDGAPRDGARQAQSYP